MLTFLTLFLGLVTGPQLVEVTASSQVATVELLVDGERREVLRGEPWKATLDLGSLAPHHLEARGLDADGDVLDRAEVWINLSRVGADAQWVIDADGSTRRARLLWQSVEHPTPSSVTVRLNGEVTELEDDWIELPPLHRNEVHVLTAELTFAGAPPVRADAVVGEGPVGRTAAELTSVAVGGRGRRLRRPAQGSVRHDGRELPVMAQDHGPADLVVVADRSALTELARLRHGVVRRAGGRLRPRIDLVDGMPRHTIDVVGADYAHPVVHAGARAGDRLYFVRPLAERSAPAGVPFDLFGVSFPLPGARAGIAWQLTNTAVYDDDDDLPQRLSDAVARAGLVAHSGGRPRAVVLIVGPEHRDSSVFSTAEVRRYLKVLGVPLQVWYLEAAFDELSPPDKKRVWEEREAERAAVEAGTILPPPTLEERVRRIAEEWSPVRYIATAAELVQASTELRNDIDRQRILWVPGLYLPQDLEVSKELRLR